MHFENLSIMAEQIREYTLRYPEGEVAYIKTNEIGVTDPKSSRGNGFLADNHPCYIEQIVYDEESRRKALRASLGEPFTEGKRKFIDRELARVSASTYRTNKIIQPGEQVTFYPIPDVCKEGDGLSNPVWFPTVTEVKVRLAYEANSRKAEGLVNTVEREVPDLEMRTESSV